MDCRYWLKVDDTNVHLFVVWEEENKNEYLFGPGAIFFFFKSPFAKGVIMG